MNTDFSFRIDQLQEKCNQVNPEINFPDILSFSKYRLGKSYPFYNTNAWEKINFSKEFDYDSLPDSQKKIILEMNAVFISILERNIATEHSNGT